MLDALKARLAEIQLVHERLPDAAITIATEVRSIVKARRRSFSRAQRRQKALLRSFGDPAAAKRYAEALGLKWSPAGSKGRRKGSGVSIDAEATDSSVVLTASTQVQHFRRLNNETADLMAIFAKHVSVADKYNARRRSAR